MGGGVKTCDKMAISAHILKIVENDPFLRLQMTAKEMLKGKEMLKLIKPVTSCYGHLVLKQSLNSLYHDKEMSVPDIFNRFYEIKHNSAIACQIRLEFLD